MSYKDICPKCNGNDFYITPENGVGYCFHCSYWTRANDIAPVEKVRSQYIDEIRFFYDKMTAYYHSAITPAVRKYINERGITDATIDLYRIGYCPAERNILYNNNIAKEAGLSKDGSAFLGGRITFPYYKDRNTITDIRGRALNSTLRYLSPLHSTFYRGADYPYNNIVNHIQQKTIIITEGEIKAIVASQNGFTAIGLPGMLSWRAGFVVLPNVKYIIIFDSQQENYKHVAIATKKIAAHFDDVFIASLPLMGKSKMDIDTFILEYGTDTFADIISTALPYRTWHALQRRF